MMSSLMSFEAVINYLLNLCKGNELFYCFLVYIFL